MVSFTSNPHVESMIASFSFASTGKCNSMVELFTSTGGDFDLTIKLTRQRAKNTVNDLPVVLKSLST